MIHWNLFLAVLCLLEIFQSNRNSRGKDFSSNWPFGCSELFHLSNSSWCLQFLWHLVSYVYTKENHAGRTYFKCKYMWHEYVEIGLSNEESIWAPKPKMDSKRPKISLQQSTYTGDLFWVAWEAQPKYKHPLSWKSICRNDSLLCLVVGEDAE